MPREAEYPTDGRMEAWSGCAIYFTYGVERMHHDRSDIVSLTILRIVLQVALQFPYQKSLSRRRPDWGRSEHCLCKRGFEVQGGCKHRVRARVADGVLLETRQRRGPRFLPTCWLLETLWTTADRVWRASERLGLGTN